MSFQKFAAFSLIFSIFLVGGANGQAHSTTRKRVAKPSAEMAAPVHFEDVATRAGLKTPLTCGGTKKLYIMEAMCGGVAFFDYDNDGWADILIVGGSTLEAVKNSEKFDCTKYETRLYHNNHDGTFTDVTAKSGLNPRPCRWGFGVAIGDYDNDGYDDVYITYLDGGALFHNNRDGTFTDVTAKAGVNNGGEWGTSAAFGDYDNDGHLDLYVASYVSLDLNNLPAFGSSVFCQYRGIPVSCGPRGLKGARDHLYHNNGDGTFTDVTEKLGIDPDANYGLGVIWADFEKHGCDDIFVADDSSPSMLYHNDCHGHFTEEGIQAGVAYSADGREQAGMGVDVSDYDHSGWPSLAKTNFSDDANNLYHNDGGSGEFTDLQAPSGFGPVSIPFLGFGLKFLDYDNDGWPDVFVANGHVNPQVDEHSFGVSYAERPFLFHNLGNGKFDEVGAQAGAPFAQKQVSRGAATADFMNNGSVGLLVAHLGEPPSLLLNESKQGHWIRIKTIGTRSNRDGYGARVEVTANGMTQMDEVRANSSYLSASDARLHFGLGDAKIVDAIRVIWPSGVVDIVKNEKADQDLVIREGAGVVERKPGKSRRRFAHRSGSKPSR
jgi:hypothetical protein